MIAIAHIISPHSDLSSVAGMASILGVVVLLVCMLLSRFKRIFRRKKDYLDRPEDDDYDLTGEEVSADFDELYYKACELGESRGEISISLIQKHLRIGYNQAKQIILRMEKDGLIGPPEDRR